VTNDLRPAGLAARGFWLFAAALICPLVHCAALR
jgi:hypothetical protein